MTTSSSIASEKVEIRKETLDIDRNFPRILEGKIQLQHWEKFCDDVDASLVPVSKVKTFEKILWTAIFVVVVLLASGFQWADSISAYYASIAPIGFILVVMVCKLEEHFGKQAMSKVRKACARLGNHRKGLTVTLNVDDVYHWHVVLSYDIEAAGEIIMEVAESESAFASASVPVVEAEPIPAVSAVITNNTTSDPPSKYVKDPSTGKMTLNPEYKAWKNQNQNKHDDRDF
mmetsp:Transcript_5306/g.13076  ORF Transcript_5306/g.13076 Transcript_5306/m.13076 type:complete len:231 (-) Transcript_5306:383-1075(-)|eukprot:CAMPEP_0172394520 /NCGR_PEP_ID=MMETSP1061-20121228/15588_1 /TAXON_ID=37318 /ORGANISM="Pseudo-nitzschia pungens, Strain cf. pungens" /LENGTH=230 /DNA_ID=CAMNT_0013125913 /DNA_START=172 /DNA_END=864 /DNA_ORIENTATION=+